MFIIIRQRNSQDPYTTSPAFVVPWLDFVGPSVKQAEKKIKKIKRKASRKGG